MGVYNGERHLAKGLKSILCQTLTDFEFIIINDGSTDKTGEILDRAANQDTCIKVIHRENAGLTKSLIHGCELARGKYIARQDADDYSYPERIERQFKHLESNPDVVMVSCWGNITGPQGELLSEIRRSTDDAEATALLLNDMVGPAGHGSVMFRKAAYESVGGYRPAFYFAQDNDLWLRLCQKGKIAYVPKILYSYQMSTESISGGLHGAKADYIALVDLCYRLRKEGKSDTELIQAFTEQQANRPHPVSISSGQKKKSSFRTNYFIGRCLIKNEDHRAFGYFLRSLRDKPVSILAWGSLVVSMWYVIKNKLRNGFPVKDD